MDVRIHETPTETAAATAAILAESLNPPATLGLAGGSTPRATYERLREEPVDWAGVTMWLGDERFVPPGHPDSNETMVRAALVDAVGGRLLAPDHSSGDPATVAFDYGRRLEAAWVDRGDGPAPDVVLLGVGDDGHTASLFPGSSTLGVTEPGYVAVWVPGKATWRLTATIPLLQSARRLVFLVTGETKARVVAEILAGVPHPAQQVASGAGDVIWMLDRAAASKVG